MAQHMQRKDQEIAFLRNQLAGLRLGGGNAGQLARKSYNDALRSACLDFTACVGCLVPFHGTFRGAPDDESNHWLALKCSNCDEENVRWYL